MRARRGLTLVEVLISTSLLACLGAAVVSLLTGGLRVWQRTDTLGTRDAWVEIAFDQVRRELRSMQHFEPIPFDGAYDRCTFASLVPAYDGTGQPLEALGATQYRYDSARRQLCRTRQTYPEWQAGRPAACSMMLQDVSQVRFSFYAPRTETGGGEWKSAWAQEDGRPSAVKLIVTYRPAPAQTPVNYETIVYLPAGAPEAAPGGA